MRTGENAIRGKIEVLYADLTSVGGHDAVVVGAREHAAVFQHDLHARLHALHKLERSLRGLEAERLGRGSVRKNIGGDVGSNVLDTDGCAVGECNGGALSETVVRSGENGDETTLGKELVAILNDLVRTADEVEIVFFKELGDNITAESVGNSTVVLTPALDLLVGIGPEEVAEDTRVGNVSGTGETTHLVHGVVLRGETTVDAEDLLVNNGSNGEAVETVSECLPELDVVATLALVVEAINAVNRSALVVATKEEEVLWVLDLVGEQEADGFEALLATVNIIAEEEVVGIGRETTILKEAKKVIVLAVNIADNLDRRLQFQENRLRDEHLA